MAWRATAVPQWALLHALTSVALYSCVPRVRSRGRCPFTLLLIGILTVTLWLYKVRSGGEGRRPLVGSLDLQHPMRRGPSSEICGDCCHYRRCHCYCFVARPSNEDACIACRRERVVEYRLGDASSGLLTCLTTESFVRAVGSRSAAPGGGSVAALLAALVSSV